LKSLILRSVSISIYITRKRI